MPLRTRGFFVDISFEANLIACKLLPRTQTGPPDENDLRPTYRAIRYIERNRFAVGADAFVSGGSSRQRMVAMVRRSPLRVHLVLAVVSALAAGLSPPHDSRG